jgi:hemolysin activation/secretion protein
VHTRRGWALLSTTLRYDLTQGIFNQLRLPLGIDFGELQVQPFRNANAAQLAGLSQEQMCVRC